MTAMQEEGIEIRVTRALDEDPRTSDALIDVASNQGVITLTGTAPSHQVRQAAEEIARQQKGVISVINDVRVQ